MKSVQRNISIETNLGGDIIGRKYLKSDEVGTPFALVVDDQSVDSKTVTIRDRDTLQQKRIPQSDIPGNIISHSQYVCKYIGQRYKVECVFPMVNVSIPPV